MAAPAHGRTRDDAPPRPLPPLARRPVLLVAGAQLALLVSMAGRYGYHRDELYFREAGHHLAWGYVDQPPFTPAVARLSIAVLGDTVASLRVVPALAAAGCAMVAAVLARELGAGRWGQVVAAGAVAGAGFTLGAGHLLTTAVFDLLAWLVLIWLVARLLRTGEPRWWLAFGAVAGLALWNKHLPALLAVTVLAAMAADRRRDLLGTRWLLGGGAVAVILAAPTLVWQAVNGWPQLEMAQAISDRIGAENRALLLPGQLVLPGPLLVPFLVVGARWLLGAGREHRPLVWAWVAALGLTFLSAGRPYYPLPLTLAVIVAGTVAVEQAGRRWRWAAPALVGASVLTALPLSLPVLPVDRLGGSPAAAINEALAETVGWPELVDQVASVVERLPDGERERVILLTATYGEAGALDRFGPERGLPSPYSPHNAYGGWRRPVDDGAPVVAVRFPAGRLRSHLDGCREVGRVDNGRGVDNEVQGAPIVVCRRVRTTWAEVWPDLRFLS